MILIVGLRAKKLFSPLYMQVKELSDFGNRVRSLRLERGLTQVQLGNIANFDRNYIGMVERGERNPSLINLHRIAKAFRISMSELFDY